MIPLILITPSVRGTMALVNPEYHGITYKMIKSKLDISEEDISMKDMCEYLNNLIYRSFIPQVAEYHESKDNIMIYLSALKLL